MSRDVPAGSESSGRVGMSYSTHSFPNRIQLLAGGLSRRYPRTARRSWVPPRPDATNSTRRSTLRPSPHCGVDGASREVPGRGRSASCPPPLGRCLGRILLIGSPSVGNHPTFVVFGTGLEPLTPRSRIWCSPFELTAAHVARLEPMSGTQVTDPQAEVPGAAGRAALTVLAGKAMTVKSEKQGARFAAPASFRPFVNRHKRNDVR